MAEKKEIVGVETQRLTDLLDLIHEAIHLPEGVVVRLVAVEGAQLIVVVVLDSRRGQITVGRLEVLVGRSRAAMEEEQPDPGIVTDPLCPYLELARRGGDRDQTHTAALNVVPP